VTEAAAVLVGYGAAVEVGVAEDSLSEQLVLSALYWAATAAMKPKAMKEAFILMVVEVLKEAGGLLVRVGGGCEEQRLLSV
jgi:hypothetical protein